MGKTYLQLNGSRSDEKQGVPIPDVNLQGLHGQVAGEPALLPGSQEPGVYKVLPLMTFYGNCNSYSSVQVESRYG